eukprot:COSAG01_NODE_2424_length_7722_cov_216.956448_5_plen_149_part_00
MISMRALPHSQSTFGGVALSKHERVLDLLVLRLQAQRLPKQGARLAVALQRVQRQALAEEPLHVRGVERDHLLRVRQGGLVVSQLELAGRAVAVAGAQQRHYRIASAASLRLQLEGFDRLHVVHRGLHVVPLLEGLVALVLVPLRHRL